MRTEDDDAEWSDVEFEHTGSHPYSVHLLHNHPIAATQLTKK
ncbi:MAG: hypothetical protein ACREOZ_03170 [Gloeomargaritales cyanobacterium]